MNRLTKKDIEGAYDFTYPNGEFVRGICPLGEHPNQEIYSNGLNKLGKLEDLEEDLGCPLEVVFKAIEDGIVIKGVVNQYSDKTLWLDNKSLEALVGEKLDFEEPRLIKYNEWCFSCHSGSYRGCVSLKDYKKTWWLKNDTSEEDILRLMTQLCKTSSDLRVLHLEPAAEVTEETKHLLEELKGKINCKPFSTTEPIDTLLKEDSDPFCLNLTTIQPPHPGGD